MKFAHRTITPLIALFAFYLPVHAAPINIGHDTQLEKVIDFDTFFTLTMKITVTEDTKLTHFGGIYAADNSKVRYGLYTDNNNAPSKLLTSVTDNKITAGTDLVSVGQPFDIAAGTYWLASVYENKTKIYGNSSSSQPYFYNLNKFDKPFDDTWDIQHEHYNFNGPDLNQFIVTDVNPSIPEPASISLLALGSFLILKRPR